MNDKNNQNDSNKSWLIGLIAILILISIPVWFFTRPVALILSGTMAVAYFYAHFPKGFFPLLNGGELAALYCFVFLFVAAAGGGAWSVDELRARNKQPSGSKVR